jgi:hypothetical protein
MAFAVELDSSIDEAPSASRSAFRRDNHRKIDCNAELHRQIDYSNKLLCNAERITTADKREQAPQVV